MPPEQEIIDQYPTLLDQAISSGQELTALRHISPDERTEAQAQQIAELVEQMSLNVSQSIALQILE